MGLRVNTNNSVPVVNCEDLAKARNADLNHDNSIDLNEAAAAYSLAAGGKKLNDAEDVYQVLGGARHKITAYNAGDNQWVLEQQGYGLYGKGNFHVEGLGAGNVKTRHMTREEHDGTPTSTFLFAVSCDMFPGDFLDKVDSAQIVIGPKSFPTREGTDLGDCATIALDVFSAPEYKGYAHRSGTPYTIPASKMLTAEVARADLAALAGESGGLSFFIEVKMKDGRTIYFNKDGESGKNFELKSEEEFKGLGQP